MTDEAKKRGGARPGAGRPRKIIASNEAEGAQDEAQEMLDELLRQPVRRRTLLQPDEKTLSSISELAKLFCTQEEAAAVLGVNYRTFKRFLSECEEARDAWDDGLQFAKVSLRRKQFARCDKSDTMNIFLGKNYLDQRDEKHTTTTTINTPASAMTEEQLMEIAMSGAKPAATEGKDKKVH